MYYISYIYKNAVRSVIIRVLIVRKGRSLTFNIIYKT